jgi:AI-2 transport protein TqsA
MGGTGPSGKAVGVEDQDQSASGLPVSAVEAPLTRQDAGRLSPSLRLLLGLAAVAIVLLAMRVAAPVIVPLLLALVITMAVAPLLRILMRHGVPRWLAWLATVVVTVVAVAFVIVLGFAGVAKLIGTIPQYQDEFAARMQDLTRTVDKGGIDISGITSGRDAILSADRVTHVSIALLKHAEGALKLTSLTLLVVFFMLWEATTINIKFSQTPPRISPALARLENYSRDMRAFVQATATSGLVAGVAIGVFLWLLGVDFPLLWATLAFVMSFIPTLGPIIAMLPPAYLALLETGWTQALLVVLGFIMIYAVVGNLVGRRMIAHRTNLSLLVVIVSVVVWGWVLGLLGGLLAVPLTLLVRRLFVEAYDEYNWVTGLLGNVRRDEQSGGSSSAAGRGNDDGGVS